MNTNKWNLTKMGKGLNQPNKKLAFWSPLLVGALIFMHVFSGCDSDDISSDSYYTFKGQTIGQYIENNDNYSEFTKILKQTGDMGLLKAYGTYTVFLPTNAAMKAFYEKEGRDSFPSDTLSKIIRDHIIKDYELTSDYFLNGFLPNLTMNGRFIKVEFDSDGSGLIYKVNTSSLIDTTDVEKHNGVVHVIDEVLSPTENTLIEAIASDDKFQLFYSALAATGYSSKLIKVKDEDYVAPDALVETYDEVIQGHGIYTRVPKERKYGYTALIESDSTYAAAGITTFEGLVAKAKELYDPMYPEDASITDYTDSRNSLNRFVGYHLLSKKVSKSLFIEKYDQSGSTYDSDGATHAVQLLDVDMYEYYEPMCGNTLIEVRTLRTNQEYNIFNMTADGNAIRLTDNYDNDAINGAYHEIDGILAYTSAVEQVIATKRIRMDAASFFDELTNNSMRVGHETPDYPSIHTVYPLGYIDRANCSSTTEMGYINADDRFADYQGDEVFLKGLYEFDIITPPIPAGTYEIRFGYQPTGNRGVAQLYWDYKPTGIPLDLRLYADNPKIGWVKPGLDPQDSEGYENDKMMRNRGYMKGPASYKSIDDVWYTGLPSRQDPAVLRRILGIYTFDEMENHTFSVKAVLSGEFMFDYLEFVPLEVLESEDIY